MFRLLSQTLPLRRSLPSTLLRRFRSTFSGDDCVIEVDLSPLSPSESGTESEALMLKKLDDVVQGLIVKKATPYWIPFLPGSSFWVPPRPGAGAGALKFGDLVEKLSDNLSDEDDEPPSFSASDFRWPSSRYYLGNASESEEAEESAEMEAETEGEASLPKLPSSDEEG